MAGYHWPKVGNLRVGFEKVRAFSRETSSLFLVPVPTAAWSYGDQGERDSSASRRLQPPNFHWVYTYRRILDSARPSVTFEIW
jgi:hypothetical protein